MNLFKKILVCIALIAVLIPTTSFAKANDSKELGISWEAGAILKFEDLENVFMDLNIKRFFLDKKEYEINIAGQIGYDETTTMFNYLINPTESKVVEAPYSSQSLGLTEIYGVVKVSTQTDGDDFIASLMYDADNQDSVPLSPSISNVMLEIQYPDESITYEDQHEENFPEVPGDDKVQIEYDYVTKIAKTPFYLVNPDDLKDYLKYEIVEAQGNPTEISVLFNLTYNLLPDYRYINENGVGKILHRVPFINRNSNYFNGYEYTALMTEISGLSITDTSDHQITMSGKVPTELEENSITFLPMNSDPNLDRPVQITKFDYPMLPPLMLNWQVYPIENTTVSVYDSSDKTIYTGNNTFVEDFLVDNFSLGKYKLIANNSLGSKMTELEVSAPDNQLIVSSVQMVKVDEFTEEEVREEVKDTLFFDNQDNTYILKINVINNPPLPLTFSPLGTNNAGTLIIEADPKEIIYPEYEEEYTVRISQISADDTDPIFTLTSGNITKEITLDLSSRMKSSKVVLTPDQMIALVGDDLEWRSLVENPNAENLILKQGLTLDDLNIIDENLKNEIQNEIEGEKALAETPDHSATTVAGSETTDLQTDDFETAGRVLGASTERILSKEEKTQSILYLGLLLLVITASFSSWFFVRKKMK